MAQRRLFSPDIVESDAFLEMPTSTQALYFHLGMNADDDGFVNPKKIMRMMGAVDDDLKVLIGKRFVLPFENGVVVIKHWLVHNSIRKDRYHATQYREEKARLVVKEGGVYTDVIPLLATTRQPDGNQMEPELNLTKPNLILQPTVAKEPFNSEEYTQSVIGNKQRHIHIVGLYWKFKGLTHASLLAAQAELTRNFRPAKALMGYTDEQILKAMDYIDNLPKRDYIWGLETVGKMILSIINNRS